MSKFHTHYDNLKVTRDAPPEVIRAAYKTLCHKFHPDRNAGSQRATQTFQLITTAYEILSDAERRSQHDDWIAQREAESIAVVRPASHASAASSQWDGRERRKRSWPAHSVQWARQWWAQRYTRSSQPLVTAALWLLIACVGMTLALLHTL